MRKQVILHPLLLALYPSLIVQAINITELARDAFVLPAIATVAFALLCWLPLNLALESREKAAILLSLFLLLFFSYGYLGRAWPAVAALVILAVYYVVKTQRRLRAITAFLNLMATALVTMSVVFIAIYELRIRPSYPDSLGMQDVRSDVDVGNPASPASLPDIYYIIVDGYARADVLDELYGFDNSEFLRSLEERGFHVADRSRANYAATAQSLASSLNMQYLDALAERVGVGCTNREPIRQMIQESRVFAFLRQYGYKLVAIKTAYRPLDLKHADVYLAPGLALGRFHMVLLHLTPIPAALARFTDYDEYDPNRQSILFVLDHLAEVPDQAAPVFVFAHILAPHPPFVFGEHSEKVSPQGGLAFGDGSMFLRQTGFSEEDYRFHYAAQLAFLNQKIKATLDGMLVKPSMPSSICCCQRTTMTPIHDRGCADLDALDPALRGRSLGLVWEATSEDNGCRAWALIGLGTILGCATGTRPVTSC